MATPMKPSSFFARSALALAVATSAVPIVLAPMQAHAQSQQQDFNIQAGALGDALNRFGQQAGILLSYPASLTDGRRSPGLQGQYGVDEGLARLLSGTGLQAVRQANGGYALALVEALSLEATQISSRALSGRAVTEGTGSYTATGGSNTATRLGLTPRETPQSITVVTRQHMDDFGLNGLDDVMRHTPGITVVPYDSERTTYYSRGFTIDSFQYDGIPTTRDTRYSSGDTLSDSAIYDHIEVLKGASGLMTGMGDPGGTINLIRKKPTREFHGHITAGAGSWDNYRTEVDLGGSLTESGNIRGRAVVAYQDKHSYLDHYERKTKVYYGVLELDLSPDTLLTLGANYMNSSPKGSSWGGTPLFDSNGNFNDTSRSFNTGAKWSSWEQYSRSVFATLEHNFAGGWAAKINLTNQVNGYDAPLAAAAGGQPNPATGLGAILSLGKFDGEIKQNAIDAYVKGPFSLMGREHEVVIGATASRREWKTKDYYPAYDSAVEDFYNWNGDIAKPDWGPAYLTEEVTRELGGYITGRFNLRDDLKLILGSRVADYRGENTTETGIWVPYAGVVYDLNKIFSLYASYTSIFKPQTRMDEQGKTLEPLDGDSYEVGIKGEFFDGRLNGSLAYFEVTQDNYAILSGSRTPGGSSAYTAVQGVKTKGYEAELSGELLPGWQAQMGYTHKTARRNGVKVATWEPEDQFSLYTTYRLPARLSPVTVGGGARWQGKSWNTLTNPVRGTREELTQGAFWLLDLMARYQISENLSASLNVNNLLDKKYYYNSEINSYTWGEPRSVSISSRWDF
ncbi:TonB-dependent siderophore receptor [Stutzerimonas kirkiae]|uniref:TonB-dependent siderophore receptor n=1 Tax=Stutzerimonas kirkiae TaxID=2211392 RepID=UPI0010383E29|nr:TonB-dependent receptor [Stutzerimonas kirkiae]TBV15008.1 TonB-dependent siderophore receptor [Stutzerimonas kirkiae]